MYKLSKEKTIVLSSNVKEKFEKYRKSLPRKESGGILLGRICLNDFIIIEEITEPSKKDIASFFSFKRDKKTAQEIINETWKGSRGEVIYLGEWHTHNEASPKPSNVDRKMIKDLLIESKMEINFLITIIVGMETNFVAIQTHKGLTPLNFSNNPFIYEIPINL